jgi:glycosyltransferase involved in cell wall biosynthesis
MMPSLTVVTICFNNLADLQKSCDSVDRQSMHPFEHWIINGSSGPEIAEWLQTTPQPAYRKWLNERDHGIADAFNKGIAHANGEVIHLLNSGDCYADNDVIETVMASFEKRPEIAWLSGNIEMTRGGMKVVVGKPFEKLKLYRGMRSVSHPTWFLKKKVYEDTGLYRQEYKIAMDYEMMCRIADVPYLYIDKTLIRFDDTGVSSLNYLQSLKENKKAYESHFGSSLLLHIWQIRLKTLHYLLQTPFGKWLFGLKKKMGGENW